MRIRRTAAEDAAGQEVYLGGTTQLLKFPEYRDADKARDLMTFMVDNKQNLPVPSGNARCGWPSDQENVDAALKESSVVAWPATISVTVCAGLGGGGEAPPAWTMPPWRPASTYFAESLTRMF